jgi:hypothetical protein
MAELHLKEAKHPQQPLDPLLRVSAANRARSSSVGDATGRGNGQWLSGVPQVSGKAFELPDIHEIFLPARGSLEADQLFTPEDAHRPILAESASPRSLGERPSWVACN